MSTLYEIEEGFSEKHKKVSKFRLFEKVKKWINNFFVSSEWETEYMKHYKKLRGK